MSGTEAAYVLQMRCLGLICASDLGHAATYGVSLTSAVLLPGYVCRVPRAALHTMQSQDQRHSYKYSPPLSPIWKKRGQQPNPASPRFNETLTSTSLPRFPVFNSFPHPPTLPDRDFEVSYAPSFTGSTDRNAVFRARRTDWRRGQHLAHK
eukprot:3066859-Rhodomonas_salina.3